MGSSFWQGGIGVVLGEKHDIKPFHPTIRRPLGIRATRPVNIQLQANVQQQVREVVHWWWCYSSVAFPSIAWTMLTTRASSASESD